jgi:hypothetical protein
MPIAGRGMLITWMDVDPDQESDFNLWYDREHLAERVGIDGFVEARRWLAIDAPTKYFCTYSTNSFETLNGPAYKAALASQTEWSRKHISRFRNPGRVIGRVTCSRGEGRGAVLGVVRLRPTHDHQEAFRLKLAPLIDPGLQPGIISLHLVESDPVLSRPLTATETADLGSEEWFVLIDGTEVDAVAGLMANRFSAKDFPVITSATYRLLWDLAKDDLAVRAP